MGNGAGAQRPFSRPSSTLPRKYDRSGQRGPGRPRTHGKIETLVIRMAEENRDWGYRRILGALSNLGHQLARGTIANILKRHGIEPAVLTENSVRAQTARVTSVREIIVI